MEMHATVMGLAAVPESLTVSGSRALLGGGWPEMVMAKRMDKLARKTPKMKSLAIEASLAFLAIPTTTADNAGLDNVELISQLQATHQEEGCTAGIDVINGFECWSQSCNNAADIEVEGLIIPSKTICDEPGVVKPSEFSHGDYNHSSTKMRKMT